MCNRTNALLAALLAVNLVQGAEPPPASLLAPMPANWSSMAGNGGPLALPGTCELGIDSQKSVADRQAYSVRCGNSVLPSYGGARNTVRTTQFRGKRVRVSAWLMASGIEGVSTPQYAHVVGEGGLWIGVGSQKGGMRMDRMQNRTIKGSTDWEFRDFVVDVPDDNNQMFVGFWMQGRGQIWARDFNIEEVPDTVPVSFLVNDPARVVGPDLSLLTTAVARPEERFLAPPAKWLTMGGAGYELCDLGIDARLLGSGQRNISIACSVPKSAALRQAAEASPFWGKRVRLSGWLKLEKFEPLAANGGQEGVGLFMTNTDVQSKTLRVNMSGTVEWQHHELVMDVPRGSTWLLVGLSLSGTGQVWARDLKFEEVSRDVPVTVVQPAPVRF